MNDRMTEVVARLLAYCELDTIFLTDSWKCLSKTSRILNSRISQQTLESIRPYDDSFISRAGSKALPVLGVRYTVHSIPMALECLQQVANRRLIHVNFVTGGYDKSRSVRAEAQVPYAKHQPQLCHTCTNFCSHSLGKITVSI